MDGSINTSAEVLASGRDDWKAARSHQPCLAPTPLQAVILLSLHPKTLSTHGQADESTLEYRQSDYVAPLCLVTVQRASPIPCRAWRYIPGPIRPRGEADMQAQSGPMNVDVAISR